MQRHCKSAVEREKVTSAILALFPRGNNCWPAERTNVGNTTLLGFVVTNNCFLVVKVLKSKISLKSSNFQNLSKNPFSARRRSSSIQKPTTQHNTTTTKDAARTSRVFPTPLTTYEEKTAVGWSCWMTISVGEGREESANRTSMIVNTSALQS